MTALLVAALLVVLWWTAKASIAAAEDARNDAENVEAIRRKYQGGGWS